MKQLVLLFLFTYSVVGAQDDPIFDRLSAMENNDKVWYNIDGYSVTSEVFHDSFDEKGLKKLFKKHSIKDADVKNKNPNISFNNWTVFRQKKITDQIYQSHSYCFVENPNRTITLVWFIKNGTTDKNMEEYLVNAIIENKIPGENFVSREISRINFAGKEIELGNNCYWTFLNTVQCPYFGEMNWSVHKTLEDAKETAENQLKIAKSRKGGKIISEEDIDIEFQDIPVKAKRLIYDFTGWKSVLAGMSGGKTLTIYYVAEKVRRKNISCTMSFWNNDEIHPDSKLPPLLEKIIKVKE